MLYKTIVLELLEQNPQLFEQLRRNKNMLSALDLYSRELKTSHEAWKKRLSHQRPGSPERQIASVAMEFAVSELDRLLSGSLPDENAPLSLDGAMAHVRQHTPPA